MHGQVEDLCLALAGALYRGGLRWAAPRQDASLAHQAAGRGDGRARRRADARGTARGKTTHWTGVLMAKAAGLSVSSVQRTWRAHGLQPHRMRQFKLSNDPRFVDKLRDVVRTLYVDPARTRQLVLSVDEKKTRFRRLIAHSRDCR